METAESELPNRWLHLRLPREFSEAEFTSFRAHAAVWSKMVDETLKYWIDLGYTYPAPEYKFFPPELSADRRTATLPLGGGQTLGTRSLFENSMSSFLWMHMPFDLQLEAEEGITEVVLEQPPSTSWRPCLERVPVGEEKSCFPRLPFAARQHRFIHGENVKWWLYATLPRW